MTFVPLSSKNFRLNRVTNTLDTHYVNSNVDTHLCSESIDSKCLVNTSHLKRITLQESKILSTDVDANLKLANIERFYDVIKDTTSGKQNFETHKNSH